MTLLAGFLDVSLRGLGLVALAVAVGGVGHVLAVLRPFLSVSQLGDPALRQSLRLMMVASMVLAGCQTLLVFGIRPWALADGSGSWPIREILSTAFGTASLVRILSALAFAGVSLRMRNHPTSRMGWALLVALSVLLLGEGAWLAHAASRLEHRGFLMLVTALHQLGVVLWLGGLVHIAALAFLYPHPEESKLRDEEFLTYAARFSLVALPAMGLVLAPGLYLAWSYIGNRGGMVGTGYGVMVLTKLALLAAALSLGGLNFLLVRRTDSGDGKGSSGALVSALVEAEVGLGLTMLLVAASLTSLPPAVDVMAERATPAEVATRLLPRLPRVTSPPAQDLLRVAGPIDDRLFPRQPEERAWSEYNHHIAGLFVLLMGFLAILDRTGRVRWARHWPLTLLGLAAFIFFRADPRAWPLGPAGFWGTMVLPDVLQHRLAGLLVVALGVFEWLVRNGRLTAPRWRLVFPLLSATGGALLLTHSHAMLNLKEEFLTEVSHAPLGFLAVLVGWGRWLELRLPPSQARLPGRIWTVSLFLIGALLLVYRES